MLQGNDFAARTERASAWGKPFGSVLVALALVAFPVVSWSLRGLCVVSWRSQGGLLVVLWFSGGGPKKQPINNRASKIRTAMPCYTL